MSLLVLAFDTSTAVAAVALAREREDGSRELLAETSVTGRGSGGSSEALLPAIHSTLGLCGFGVTDLDLLLVGLGPGTFTGIRISAATARSLALGTGAALARGDTLSALGAPALSALGEGGSVLSVVDARRGEVFVRRFDAEGWASGDIVCAVPGELPQELAATLVVGDGAARYREQLERLGRVPPDASPLHRVTASGMAAVSDLSPVAPEALAPVYVREPDAETRRERNPWSRA